MSTFKLLLITIVGWAFGSFFYKIANDKMHPLVVEVFATAAYVIALPFCLMYFKPTWEMSASGIFYSALGALAMCGGTIAYFYLLKNGGQVGEVTTLAALYPGLTIILSYMFLGETFSIKKCFGILLAFVSIYIISSK